MTSAPLPPAVEHGAGLVVMLDAAGRTIAQLEHRVDQLGAALLAERQERQRIADLLAECRGECAATGDVPTTQQPADNNGRHARQDSPPPAT